MNFIGCYDRSPDSSFCDRYQDLYDNTKNLYVFRDNYILHLGFIRRLFNANID